VQPDRQVYEVVSGFRSSWYWLAIGRVSWTRQRGGPSERDATRTTHNAAHYCRNRLSDWFVF